MTDLRKVARGPRLVNGEKRVVPIKTNLTESLASDMERLRLEREQPLSQSAWMFEAAREKVQRETFGAAITGAVGSFHALCVGLAESAEAQASTLRQAAAFIEMEAGSRLAEQARADGTRTLSGLHGAGD